jgi:hypothetical protein
MGYEKEAVLTVARLGTGDQAFPTRRERNPSRMGHLQIISCHADCQTSRYEAHTLSIEAVHHTTDELELVL